MKILTAAIIISINIIKVINNLIYQSTTCSSNLYIKKHKRRCILKGITQYKPHCDSRRKLVGFGMGEKKDTETDHIILTVCIFALSF